MMLRPNPTIARWITATCVGALVAASLGTTADIAGASTETLLNLCIGWLLLLGAATPIRTASMKLRAGLFLPATALLFADELIHSISIGLQTVIGDTVLAHPVSAFLLLIVTS